ncbi:MAG: hypothetical protein QNJ89_11990 [Acidimicrobiia bacterium]|nr:hypothetical protein [Acidimicrobiia bacterium]
MRRRRNASVGQVLAGMLIGGLVGFLLAGTVGFLVPLDTPDTIGEGIAQVLLVYAGFVAGGATLGAVIASRR